jgi:hypothetical protein
MTVPSKLKQQFTAKQPLLVHKDVTDFLFDETKQKQVTFTTSSV